MSPWLHAVREPRAVLLEDGYFFRKFSAEVMDDRAAQLEPATGGIRNSKPSLAHPSTPAMGRSIRTSSQDPKAAPRPVMLCNPNHEGSHCVLHAVKLFTNHTGGRSRPAHWMLKGH